MKKLTKINLLNLCQTELAKREERQLQGGSACMCACNTTCGCKYAGPQEGPDDSFYGGSSTSANKQANWGNPVSNSTSISTVIPQNK